VAVLAVLAAAAAALVLAACGSSSSSGGTEADPAGAVPATTPLYVGADIRPTGSESSGALAAGKALTGGNPYPRLLGALRTPGSPPLDYSRDVEPWLGPHAGLFALSLKSAQALVGPLTASLAGSGAVAALPFSAGGLDGAVVMDTSDAGAARSFLAAQAKRAGAHPSSYRGVSYEVSPGGVAFGLVKSFAVIGSESGLRAVIGVTQGEAPLVKASGYAQLASSAPSSAIAHLYVSPGSAHAGTGAQQGLLDAVAGSGQTYASLVASAGSLQLDIDTLPRPGAPQSGGQASAGLLSYDPESAQALSELPGESWLGIGIGHAASGLSATAAGLSALSSLGSEPEAGSLSLGALVKGLTGPLEVLGADTPAARRDYTSWMGSAGIFAAGSSVLDLRAAVVISSTDASRSRAAVGKLAKQLRAAGYEASKATIPGTEAAVAIRLPGVPLVAYVAAGSGANGPKFVLGLGEPSVATALSPSGTLADSPVRAAAASALGEGIEPSVIVDFPTMLALLEGVGLGEDPSLASVLPYLRASTRLAGGGHKLDDGIERFRLVLGLRASG
jgi:hypothetical protein